MMISCPSGLRQIVMLILAVLVFANPAAATGTDGVDPAVAVIGAGTVAKNNPAAARQEAIRCASLAAVETVVAQILPVEAIAQHFAFLNEQIYNRAETFVLNYKVLAEWQAEGQYRLLMACTLAVDRLKDEIGRSTVTAETAAGSDPLQPPAVNEARTVTILVRGAQPLANFVRFRRILGGLPGVENVQTREMGGNQATLQIRFKGEPAVLSEAIGQINADAFHLQIFEATADHIGVDLLPQ